MDFGIKLMSKERGGNNMKQIKTQYRLIPAQGADEIVFDFFEPDTLMGSIAAVDEQYLKQLQEIESIQSFRIVLGQSKEYLLKIIQNSGYKERLINTLDIAKKDLNFNKQYEETLSLDQKITNSKKIKGLQPKPPI